MNPEVLFESNLSLIQRIIDFVCRVNHVTPSEAEGFSAYVKEKLAQDDFAVLRKFEGRVSLSTYLTIVIKRLYFQLRVEKWGKWRPSAEAKRMGEMAITLERLITRDGYSFAEACSMLPEESPENLQKILTRLCSRPHLVSEVAEDTFKAEVPFAGALDHVAGVRRIVDGLDNAMSNLNQEDRILLKMRFYDCLTVRQIADLLGTDNKKLYKRIERLLESLREDLESQAISRDVSNDFLGYREPPEATTLPSNIRTIKTAESSGIYINPETARRTLEELLRKPASSSGHK